jgi:hypothetical protein
MSSTPPPTSSMFASLNIKDPESHSPPASPDAATKGEFASLTLGITSPTAGIKGGLKTSTIENSVQLLPGVTVGQSVVHITEPEKLCCGLIGNSGTKFCIKSKDCTTSTHVLPMRKHQVSSGLYILDKRTGGCLVNPVLDTSNLDESLIDRLLSTEGEFEDLRNEFTIGKSL